MTNLGKGGNDLIVGDNASPYGNATGPTGNDYINGGLGNDLMIGDNYGRSSAKGASRDRILGLGGHDRLIGDSAAIGAGKARGGAPGQAHRRRREPPRRRR